MSRRLISALVVAAVALVAVYWFVVRTDRADPHVQVPQLSATIGEGDEAVGITGSGAAVRWLPLPEDPPLPRLPLDEIPKGGRVKGTALEQVRILAAVPDELRPFVEASSFGESGVDVILTTGIEIRFGDATQAQQKWNAAAAILADPSVTALDYVNVIAPSRATYYGSGHELPSPP
ncbi:MAG: cell division protein FtsQ [Solirubrobacterales bacterium]|nr:cell division protein FtsQ [Solirubrobacterales bacterium]